MENDKEFGSFWELIFSEYKLTKTVLLKISNFQSLMENEPAGKASINARIGNDQFGNVGFELYKNENVNTEGLFVVQNEKTVPDISSFMLFMSPPTHSTNIISSIEI